MDPFADRQQKRERVSLLLDFYGVLLADGAREALVAYNEDDWSLAEIAERLSVSRQAIHDRLRQGLDRLEHYETQLGLVKRFMRQKQALQAARADLEAGRLEALRRQLVHLEGLL